MSTPFYDLASLVVVPSGYKASKVYAQKPLTTDGQLAFTRSTTATRVNSAGLIEEVAINVPRLDYLNSTCPKLLLEPQRTNITFWSEQFEQAFWFKLGTGLTVSANTTISPDGTQNADTLNVSNNNNILYSSRTGTLTGNTYTFSIYAKGNGTFTMSARLNSITTTTETKTLTSQWQRFVVSVTNAVPVTSVEFYLELNTASTYNIWGAQVEQGAYATSYIKTTTAEVTRGADVCAKTSISSIIGSTQGSAYFEATVRDTGATSAVFFEIVNGTSTTNTIVLYIDSTNGRIALYLGPVALTPYLSATSKQGQNVKIAFRWKLNDYAFYLDGAQVYTNTSAAAPSGLNALRVGNNRDGLDVGTTNVKQVLLFNTALTNAQLAELTTI